MGPTSMRVGEKKNERGQPDASDRPGVSYTKRGGEKGGTRKPRTENKPYLKINSRKGKRVGKDLAGKSFVEWDNDKPKQGEPNETSWEKLSASQTGRDQGWGNTRRRQGKRPGANRT